MLMVMILGYHFIFSAYGFWLPNDPRGSWSDVVREVELRAFGEATKVTGARSYAADPHDVELRQAAKSALRYSPVRFDEAQRKAIAKGFELACTEKGYKTFALAIMTDHIHMVLGRHERHIDSIAAHLKSKAARAMTEAAIHPMARYRSASGRVPSPWARGYWCPYIKDEAHMGNAIEYVEGNPVKARMARQTWDFVVPYPYRQQT